MKYSIIYNKAASKEISKLSKKDIGAIINKIDSLEDNPRPSGCKKLIGLFEDLWRIRIGNYRVIYAIEDEVRIVEVRRVGDRKNIYD